MWSVNQRVPNRAEKAGKTEKHVVFRKKAGKAGKHIPYSVCSAGKAGKKFFRVMMYSLKHVFVIICLSWYDSIECEIDLPGQYFLSITLKSVFMETFASFEFTNFFSFFALFLARF